MLLGLLFRLFLGCRSISRLLTARFCLCRLLGVGTLATVFLVAQGNLLAVLVDSAVLQVCQALVGQNLKATAKLATPLAVHGRKEPFLQVRIDIGMYIDHEVAQAKYLNHIFEFLEESVGEKNRGIHTTFAKTRRTLLVDSDVEHRTHTLARDLHKTELAQRQYIVPGAVVCHYFAHVVVELLSVFGLGHIDEVDHDDAAHVAQT